MRAAEMASIGTSTVRADDGDDENDDSDSGAAASVCAEAALVMPFQPHIILDKIIVRMIEDAMPDRHEEVCEGFEVVHGCSA